MIMMSTNLLLILALWVDEDGGNKLKEDVFEQFPGELEAHRLI